MALKYTRIALDAGLGDSSGMLVLRDGALLAVVAQLSEIHDDLAGQWYVEALFHSSLVAPRDPFPDLAAFDDWLCTRLRQVAER